MASTCYTSIDLCAIRVAKLTTGGSPDTGATNGYQTGAAIKLEITVEIETGEEFTQKDGCGEICATFKEPDKIKRLSLAMDLCQLDALLLEFMTGASSFSSGGNIVGSQFAAVGTNPDPVCVEAWSKAWDNDQQAVVPFTSPDATYIHWVFPYTTWVQGNLVVEHNLMVVPVTGNGRENANITANGPFDDWPTAISNAGGITRIGGWFFDDALPADLDACEAIAVTSAAS